MVFSSIRATKRRSSKALPRPGRNHVAAGGGKGVGGMLTFRKDSGESVERQNETCLGCHQRGIQAFWKASPHESRGIACVNCHTLMEKTSGKQMAKLTDVTPFGINRAEIEVCGQCHLQRKAQLMRSSHMPMREGKIVCSDCHNPHGGPNPSQLKQTSVNENCYTCHAERRGPFLWEHPPMLEGCNNCHEPHGSVNDRLLKVTDPRLCTSVIHTRHRCARPLSRQCRPSVHQWCVSRTIPMSGRCVAITIRKFSPLGKEIGYEAEKPH
jgi:DmsE family decaheme c-type cytochrome